ncbi:MAG: LysR substrate-binding domain-containing protein, partial [Casimicrobium sp.]
NTSAAVRANRSRRIVHVRAQMSFSTIWLLPRVTAFNNSNRDIEIHLHALPFDRNPSKGGADISIYQERQDVDGYTQERLLSGQYRVYGAADLVSKLAAATPEELLTQPLLHTTGDNPLWHPPTLHDWFVAAQLSPPDVMPGMHFNLEYLTGAACIQGMGFALLLDALANDHVREGCLVEISGPAIDNPHPYSLMMKRHANDEVLHVRDWLLTDAPG